jgi:hypothetical protein
MTKICKYCGGRGTNEMNSVDANFISTRIRVSCVACSGVNCIDIAREITREFSNKNMKHETPKTRL